MTLVSEWAQSKTSIVVDSTRLDVDPTCPTQLGSFQDGDCQLVIDIIGNVATVAALSGTLGVIGVLLIICSIMIIVFVAQKKRKWSTPRYTALF